MAFGDYKIDPTVKRRFRQGGPPDPGHPRRCQGKNKLTKFQCGRWAIRGSHYCEMHQLGGGNGTITTRSVYRHIAGPKILEHLTNLANDPEYVNQRESLAEEIDVSRLLVGRAMKAYETVCLNGGKKEDGTPYSPETVAAAATNLKMSMESLSELIKKHSQVQALCAGKINTDHLPYIISQIIKITADVFGDSPEVQAKIQMITDRAKDIRMPKNPGEAPPIQLAIL